MEHSSSRGETPSPPLFVGSHCHVFVDTPSSGTQTFAETESDDTVLLRYEYRNVKLPPLAEAARSTAYDRLVACGVLSDCTMDIGAGSIVLRRNAFVGRSLAVAFSELVDRHLDERLNFAARLFALLERIHRVGVVHGRFSPEHVIVDIALGEVTLCGFGAPIPIGVPPAIALGPLVLRDRNVIAAPEFFHRPHTPIGESSDLYAFGKILSSLLPEATDIPPLRSFLQRLTAVLPTDRYADTAAAIDAFCSLVEVDVDRSSGCAESAPSADKRLITAVEREAEGRVAALWNRIEKDEAVLITGTRTDDSAFGNAVSRWVAERGGLFAYGQWNPVSRQVPYAGIRSFGRQMAQALGTLTDAQLRRFRSEIQSRFPNREYVALQILYGVEALLEIDVPSHVRHFPPVPQDIDLVVYELLSGIAVVARPIVLFFDNFDLADRDSARILAKIVSQPIPGVRIVATLRGDDDQAPLSAELRRVVPDIDARFYRLRIAEAPTAAGFERHLVAAVRSGDPELYRFLEAAATVDEPFRLALLARVTGISLRRCAELALSALTRGVLSSRPSSYGSEYGALDFRSGAIRQAIYARLSDDIRRRLHWAVGNAFREEAEIDGEPALVFVSANQLNLGFPYAPSHAETTVAADAFALAARRAIQGGSYESAVEYAERGLEITATRFSAVARRQRSALVRALARALHLAGRYEEALAELSRRSGEFSRPTDRLWLAEAEFYIRTAVVPHTNLGLRSQFRTYYHQIRAVLADAGVRVPRSMNVASTLSTVLLLAVWVRFVGLRRLTGRREPVEGSRRWSIGRLLVLASGAAYAFDPHLTAAVQGRIALHTFRYGVSAGSAFSFSIVSTILLGLLRDKWGCLRFADLSQALLSSPSAREERGRTLFLLAVTAEPLRRSLKDTWDMLDRARVAAIETGDIQFVAQSYVLSLVSQFHAGVTLPELRRRFDDGLRTIRAARPQPHVKMLEIGVRAIERLATYVETGGRAPHAHTWEHDSDIDDLDDPLRAVHGFLNTLFTLSRGDYVSAVRVSVKATKLLVSFTAQEISVRFRYLRALALAAAGVDSRELTGHVSLLRRYARYNRTVYRPRLALLEAIRVARSGRIDAAYRRFEEAADGFEALGDVWNRAIGLRLYAEAVQRRGLSELADSLYGHSAEYFRRWGAPGIAALTVHRVSSPHIRAAWATTSAESGESAVRDAVPIDEEAKNERYTRSHLDGMNIDGARAFLDEYMHTHTPYRDSSLKLEGLARAVGLRPHQLSELLNRVIGTSFSSYVNGYRVRAAEALLRDKTGISILDVAFEAGFNSKTSFNVIFRRETGMSPSEYRSMYGAS